MNQFVSHAIIVASVVLTACQAKASSVRVGPEGEPTPVDVPVSDEQLGQIKALCGQWAALAVVVKPELAEVICVDSLTTFVGTNGGLPEPKPMPSSGGTVYVDFALAQYTTNRAVDLGAIAFSDGNIARSALQQLIDNAVENQ